MAGGGVMLELIGLYVITPLVFVGFLAWIMDY